MILSMLKGTHCEKLAGVNGARAFAGLPFYRLIHSPSICPRWLEQAVWWIYVGHRFMKVKRGFHLETEGVTAKYLLSTDWRNNCCLTGKLYPDAP